MTNLDDALSNKDSGTPVTPEEPKVEEPKQPDVSEQLSQLSETINTLASGLETLNEKVSSFDKPAAPAPAAETPIAPLTWDEVYNKAGEVAQAKAQEVLDSEKKAVNEARIAQENVIKDTDAFIDNQVNDLEKDGFLPKIANENDDNDPGKKARQELFGAAFHLNTGDLKAVSSQLKVLHEAGYTFDYKTKTYIKSGAQPSGWNAPVASSGHTTSPNKPSGKDIFGARDLDEVVARFG